MFKTIALVVAGALAALLLFAATRPDVFRVQRSAHIEASPEKIYPFINDMRQFNSWNPFVLKDSNARGDYRGPAAGAGAGYDFPGNKDVGKGSIEIVDAAAPARVAMRLDMVEPFEGYNAIEFTLKPGGSGTDVTWAMQGPSPYIAKLAGIFFNMDKMIGGDFEKGLAQMKSVAEAANQKQRTAIPSPEEAGRP